MLMVLGCNQRPSDVRNKGQIDSTTSEILPTDSAAAQKNYLKSIIHRDFDNDSLLIDLPELKRTVRSIVLKSKKVEEKNYGAGDYYGKYRVYAYKFDTLIIDKGDGGDYGFGNALYLKRNDSLILYRKYELTSMFSDSGQTQEVTEQIVAFKNGSMTLTQRQMTTKDWCELNFGLIKFDTIVDDPIKYYNSINEDLNHLYKRQFMID